MYNNRPHHLLEQIPLTVSPFISLPTATTLSYNYKTMPSTIPPSPLGIPTASSPSSPSSQPTTLQDRPKFIVSESGNHTANPDNIRESCHLLKTYISKLQDDAEEELKAFEERRRERELAEKRRVAPGWLDSEERMLEPEKMKKEGDDVGAQQNLLDRETEEQQSAAERTAAEQGAQLDRAFGDMGLK